MNCAFPSAEVESEMAAFNAEEVAEVEGFEEWAQSGQDDEDEGVVVQQDHSQQQQQQHIIEGYGNPGINSNSLKFLIPRLRSNLISCFGMGFRPEL